MAKKQRHESLKQLRKICGLTQQQLADKIGVSKAAIVAIEVGQMPMSDGMARRIETKTGCYSGSLRDPDATPATLSGAPFTLENYQAWRTKRPDNALTPELLQKFNRISELVFRAAGNRRYVAEATRRLLFDYASTLRELDLISALADAALEMNEPDLGDILLLSFFAAFETRTDHEKEKVRAARLDMLRKLKQSPRWVGDVKRINFHRFLTSRSNWPFVRMPGGVGGEFRQEGVVLYKRSESGKKLPLSNIEVRKLLKTNPEWKPFVLNGTPTTAADDARGSF